MLHVPVKPDWNSCHKLNAMAICHVMVVKVGRLTCAQFSHKLASDIRYSRSSM